MQRRTVGSNAAQTVCSDPPSISLPFLFLCISVWTGGHWIQCIELPRALWVEIVSRGRLLLDYDANSVTASSQTPAPAVVARPCSVWLVLTNKFADLSSAWRDSHLNRKEGTPTPRSRRRQIPFGKVRIGRLTIILLSLLLLLRGIS